MIRSQKGEKNNNWKGGKIVMDRQDLKGKIGLSIFKTNYAYKRKFQI